jgi:hypothetical protein
MTGNNQCLRQRGECNIGSTVATTWRSREKRAQSDFGILDLSSYARSLVAPAQVDLACYHVRMQTVLPGTLLLE